MEDKYTKLRHLTRARLGLVWKMAKAGAELEGEDARLAEVLEQHPAYADIWDNVDSLSPGEEVLRDGVNPFIHVTTHTVVENQIADRTPPQTAEALEVLMQAGYTRHEAVHAIGSIVIQEIFDILKDDRPSDEAGYLEALDELVRTTESRRKQRSRQRKRRSS